MMTSSVAGRCKGRFDKAVSEFTLQMWDKREYSSSFSGNREPYARNKKCRVMFTMRNWAALYSSAM
jgi:hypothetical protein